MGKKKFFAAAFAAFVLWAIVILQTVLTRWYVSQTAFEQAFAKSDIMKASTQEANTDWGGEKLTVTYSENILHCVVE